VTFLISAGLSEGICRPRRIACNGWPGQSRWGTELRPKPQWGRSPPALSKSLPTGMLDPLPAVNRTYPITALAQIVAPAIPLRACTSHSRTSPSPPRRGARRRRARRAGEAVCPSPPCCLSALVAGNETRLMPGLSPGFHTGQHLEQPWATSPHRGTSLHLLSRPRLPAFSRPLAVAVNVGLRSAL